MSGGNEGEISNPGAVITKASVIFDVVAMPIETPLRLAGIEHEKEIINGLEVLALQTAIQFELYTGIKLTEDQVQRASAFSRQ